MLLTLSALSDLVILRFCDLQPPGSPNSAIAACAFAIWGLQITSNVWGGLGLRFSNRSRLSLML